MCKEAPRLAGRLLCATSSLRPSHSPGGLDRQAAAVADADEGDGDDVDPRTLAEAAARLAHLTSEERAGPGPAAQWADVFKVTCCDVV
jgi:hypothetical protein